VSILGHRIEQIPEVPLVIADKVQELKKTKEAVAVLRRLKAWPDIEKVELFSERSHESRLGHDLIEKHGRTAILCHHLTSFRIAAITYTTGGI